MINAVRIRKVQLRYYGPHICIPADPMTFPAQAAMVLKRWLVIDDVERMGALLVNGRHVPIGFSEISQGTLTASLVHPRELFRGAIRMSAMGLIMGHNHPSGNPKPSPEDVSMHSRMQDAGKIVGIQVLDHLVLTQDEFASIATRKTQFYEEGAYPTTTPKIPKVAERSND